MRLARGNIVQNLQPRASVDFSLPAVHCQKGERDSHPSKDPSGNSSSLLESQGRKHTDRVVIIYVLGTVLAAEPLPNLHEGTVKPRKESTVRTGVRHIAHRSGWLHFAPGAGGCPRLG